MTSWENESFELLNHVRFRFIDPGPLHAPIHKFSVRRDDRLNLILETEAPPDAESAAVEYPSGTVRINRDQAKLAYIAGVEAVLTGLQPLTPMPRYDGNDVIALKQVAHVHELKVTLGDLGSAAYTIEWLENLPASPFIWPDSVDTVTETTTTRRIALSDEGITLASCNRRQSVTSNAAKLTVAGQTLYVCAPDREGPDAELKPGCIVYVGTPDDLTRKKIRTALSFALGMYLTELGHTLYDQGWHVISATSLSAYNLAKRIFDPAPMPLAPLGNRGFQHDLGRAELTRMVSALVAVHEALDLGNLSWAYWHACAATVHIAPAHFGAAIEALLRAFEKSHPGKITTKILDTALYKKLQGAIASVIADAQVPEDSKHALSENLGGINRVPPRTSLKALAEAIGIKLGSDEDAAWKRRNDAAHGRPIPEGDELAAIRDMKLLRGLFHRMLLRISNATDSYIDYVSLNHPYRRLEEPVPPMPGAADK
jgi:hypothetical protein